MKLVGTLIKLESTRFPRMRFEWEYMPDSLQVNVCKFQIAGPWRESESLAEDDGKRLAKIARQLAKQLAELELKGLDDLIRESAKKRRR